MKYSDIVHCFTQENRINIIENKFPEIMVKHDKECNHVECNYREMKMIEEATGGEVDMKNLYPDNE